MFEELITIFNDHMTLVMIGINPSNTETIINGTTIT